MLCIVRIYREIHNAHYRDLSDELSWKMSWFGLDHWKTPNVFDVMASMLTSSGFKSLSGKTKDHGISIFCFSAKHTQNQNNYSSTIKIQGARVVQWVRSLDLTAHTSLSPIRRGFAPSFVSYKKGCTQLAAASDKVYQLLAQGRWFSPGTTASSTTKTGRHDIAEILLKVALNTKNSNSNSYKNPTKQCRHDQNVTCPYHDWYN